MRIVMIEDEARIASFVKSGLESEGFLVEHADDGAAGLELVLDTDPDLVILDLILPRMGGEEVLRRLRGAGKTMPVLILTAKDAIPDRVANLNAGADDYLVKPFSFSELVARIRARLRVTDQPTSTVLERNGVTLDLTRREVRVDGRQAELTARELALLETLMRHAGQVLSQNQLLDQVWGYDHDPGSNVVEVYVRYLRRKLRPDLIETVRGAGYRFADPT
ncbi:MAG: response regulator transcription factor [Chloroflexota bacterium]|nr:response regulator transcription factor [Chloroflexota bacterium]